jgi:TMEM175 potassium channel family protein
MSDAETRFSKARLEMLSDGIFTVAMTLLVLELRPPDLPKPSEPAVIWHALREHSLPFLGFALTFILAGGSWIMHHRMFQHIRGANRPLVLLSIPYLMFVSFLPFSTSMLTAFGTRNPVGLTFYIGNQFALSALLALQLVAASRSGLLVGAADDPTRRRTGRIILAMPVGFLAPLAVVYFAPERTMAAIAISLALVAAIARRLDRRQTAPAPAPAPV